MSKKKELTLQKTRAFYTKMKASSMEQGTFYEMPKAIEEKLERLEMVHISDMTSADVKHLQDLIDNILHLNATHNKLIANKGIKESKAIIDDTVKGVESFGKTKVKGEYVQDLASGAFWPQGYAPELSSYFSL